MTTNNSQFLHCCTRMDRRGQSKDAFSLAFCLTVAKSIYKSQKKKSNARNGGAAKEFGQIRKFLYDSSHLFWTEWPQRLHSSWLKAICWCLVWKLSALSAGENLTHTPVPGSKEVWQLQIPATTSLGFTQAAETTQAGPPPPRPKAQQDTICNPAFSQLSQQTLLLNRFVFCLPVGDTVLFQWRQTLSADEEQGVRVSD